MPRVAFICKQCGVSLTDFLEEYPEARLLLETGSEVVPSAAFVRLSAAWTYRQFVTGHSLLHHYVSSDGDVLAFLRGDILVRSTEIRHSVSARASSGCCGPQPRAEANALCQCGHDLGTLHGDRCWSPLVFRIFSHAVSEVVV